MPADYLHNHSQFADLIRIIAAEKGIDPALVEKDYWIMHCLYGLQQLGLKFELKGGTSLSKGHKIISRFSEDIDIQIHPPREMNVKTGRNQMEAAHLESRKKFYDWLAETIHIDGIVKVARDTAFDDKRYRSGGIRLSYDGLTSSLLI
jgi:Nucleotidyl transferase AbiEii toxin, Type IV TA system